MIQRKNGTNGMKSYLIHTLTSIILLGAGALFSTVVWPAIEKNTDDIQTLKGLHQADYSELSMGQQAIRLDIQHMVDRRAFVDSLFLDKFDRIEKKIGE